MERGLTVAVAGAAILIVGLSGCSDNKSSTGNGGTSPATTSATSGGGVTGTKVLIDGKDQGVSGSVVCNTLAGTINIAIGASATATGIVVVLSDANPPEVNSVALGNVNGVSLAYGAGQGGDASATKSGNSYKITGHATGFDIANPTQPAKKPFEIDVTCP